MVVLRRRPLSGFVELPFVHGGQDNRAAARRALAVAYLTSSPASIAVEIVVERDTILVHRLAATDVTALLKAVE